MALLQHRADRKECQRADCGKLVFLGQPGRCILSPPGRNSNRTRAAGGTMKKESCEGFAVAPAFRSGVTMERRIWQRTIQNYCPRRAILGSGKNEKHPASRSAQAAPSDMPLATSLG